MHISFLPDEVLGNILSSLPTKQAASTSVLSKRWRNLFVLAHTLDFDDSLFLQPEEGKQEKNLIQESFRIRECFRNFVDRTLDLQCGSPIKKFSLKYNIDQKSEMAYVYRWICNALERCVSELDVSVKLKPRYHTFVPSDQDFFANIFTFARKASHSESILPRELFTSKTLVKLTLGKRFTLAKLPLDLSLPALKYLFIDSVFFEFENDLCDVFLPGCPVLEEFSVDYYFAGSPFFISSQSIKRLRVHYDIGSVTDSFGGLSIEAPVLVSLDYSGYALPAYPHFNLESLVEARLDLHPKERFPLEPNVTIFFIGIRNVKFLCLSPVSIDVISGCVKRGFVLPVFNNVVSLSLESSNKQGWKLLPYLLKQSPKLKTLIVQGLDSYTGDVTFRAYQVKVLRVRGYRGTSEELEKLMNFIGKTKSLQLVQLEIAQGVMVDWQTKLMMLPGVSVSRYCKIEVVGFI